jgi:DNA-binding MarR family transcriptional regulator
MEFEQLKLSNQICFPLYAASRLVIKEYQPHLEKLGITYPQYLVLLVLWEEDNVTVNFIAKKLYLNTNTITPLLQRMEKLNVITRSRDTKDERKVYIKLTNKGVDMKIQARDIPLTIGSCFIDESFTLDQLKRLHKDLYAVIELFSEKNI